MASMRMRAKKAAKAEAAAVRQLDALLQAAGTADVQLAGDGGEAVALPESVRELLTQLVHDLADGKAVAVLPMDADLTTQEAADLLNVPRPYLLKLLDADKIPFTSGGLDRRLKLEDVLAYRERLSKYRRKLLDQLTQEAQAMGLYD